MIEEDVIVNLLHPLLILLDRNILVLAFAVLNSLATEDGITEFTIMHLLRRELAVLAGRDASLYAAVELGFVVVIVPELDEILIQLIVSLVFLLLLHPGIVKRLPIIKVDTEIFKHLLEDV